MAGPSLEFNAASVGYGDTVIVRNVTLAVQPGQIVGLIGPNGSGKSTLVRALTSDADFIGGRINVLGRSLSEYAPEERARVLAVVPQSITVPYAMTVREYVALGRSAHRSRFGSLSPEDRTALECALRLTDTDYLHDKGVDELSGGELQRVAVAQALVSEPKVLLLDEPTNHLDLRHRLSLLQLVRDLTADGLAVLGVFHDFELAARYSDALSVVRPVDLTEGHIVSQVSEPSGPAAVVTEQMVREVFAVDAKVWHDGETGATVVVPRR